MWTVWQRWRRRERSASTMDRFPRNWCHSSYSRYRRWRAYLQACSAPKSGDFATPRAFGGASSGTGTPPACPLGSLSRPRVPVLLAPPSSATFHPCACLRWPRLSIPSSWSPTLSLIRRGSYTCSLPRGGDSEAIRSIPRRSCRSTCASQVKAMLAAFLLQWGRVEPPPPRRDSGPP